MLQGPTAAKFKSPDLIGSDLPGIIGQQTLKGNRCLIDCFDLILYTIGEGGYKIDLSPGSDKFKLVESEAGHVFLPCGVYPNEAWNQQPTMSFVSGTE